MGRKEQSLLTERIFAAGLQELGGTTNRILLFPVTKERRLPDNFPLNTPLVPLVSTENDLQVAELIAEPLSRLLQAARKDDQKPRLISAWRSIATQTALFKESVQREKKENTGFTHEEAVSEVSTYLAPPGCSEHHLLAVDIVEQDDFDNPDLKNVFDPARRNYSSGLYLWFRNHAHEYGFVISYPTGPVDINHAKETSGYPSPEPWHLRYVGPTIAQALIDNFYLNPNNSLTLNSFLEEHCKVK